ncbi:MAG: YdcF family protein [Clostridia bacterium]|nr:YdcF family protein [Clostridia bacterium]
MVKDRKIIRLEDKSRITLENMVNAYDILGPDKRVAIVSSDYHMNMAMTDSRSAGLDAYPVGAYTPGREYAEKMRAMLAHFEERLVEMRAQGMTDREIIQKCMEHFHPKDFENARRSVFSIGEMMEMQSALLEKYKDRWEHLTPEAGRNHLLWMICEIGEVIDIIKKNGDRPSCTDPALRAHLIEEMADVLMFYNDVLLCYGITEEELKKTYVEKFHKNLSRW